MLWTAELLIDKEVSQEAATHRKSMNETIENWLVSNSEYTLKQAKKNAPQDIEQATEFAMEVLQMVADAKNRLGRVCPDKDRNNKN